MATQQVKQTMELIKEKKVNFKWLYDHAGYFTSNEYNLLEAYLLSLR